MYMFQHLIFPLYCNNHIPNYPPKGVQRPNGRDVKSVVAKARTRVAGSTAVPPLPPSYEHLLPELTTSAASFARSWLQREKEAARHGDRRRLEALLIVEAMILKPQDPARPSVSE
ncbi:hypothetical protein Rs2_29215 [Raphanus sativus]|nr:hypothetical protein Rs2_29215 [Raphanus sativus]